MKSDDGDSSGSGGFEKVFASRERAKKQKISASLRKNVWKHHVGFRTAETLCQACYKETINSFDFECGHIIPESKGGETTIHNLKPISSACNRSMATQTLYEFQIKNGYRPPPGYFELMSNGLAKLAYSSWNGAQWSFMWLASNYFKNVKQSPTWKMFIKK